MSNRPNKRPPPAATAAQADLPAAAVQAGHALAATTPSETSASVLRQFRIIFNAARTHFRQVEQATGMSGTQLWALHLIQSHPGLGVNGLAQQLDIRQPTASGLIKALMTRELVEVRREAKDRREVQLHITSLGESILSQAPTPFSGVLPQALSLLPHETLAALEADLATLIRILDPDGRGSKVPIGLTPFGR